MNRFTHPLALLVLVIFPEAIIRGQQTQASHIEGTRIDSISQISRKYILVDEWFRQPQVRFSTMWLSSTPFVNTRHLDIRYFDLEDSGDSVSTRELRIVKSIGFGLLGAGVGFGLGSLTVEITSHPHGEDAGVALLAGGAIGASLLMPIGVHLGNECRGNLALDYLPLLATGGGALLLAGQAHDASPFILLGIVDFAATILVEQLVGH